MIAGIRSAVVRLYQVSDRLIFLFFAVGVLTSPFYRVDYMREHVLGTATVSVSAGLAVLALGVCVAWRSMLRRDFTWADPARLTWADLTDARIGVLGRRLWAGWVARFVTVAYATAVVALLLGRSSWLPAGGALFCGVALLSVVVARRAPSGADRWLEYGVVVATVVLAGFAAATAVGPLPLWIMAGAAVLVAVGCAIGSGPWRRPAAATSADRDTLVRGHLARTVRNVMVSFGDALALLPAPVAPPFPTLLAGRFVVGRFVLTGIVSRARSVLLAVLCVVAIVVLHHVFPLVSTVWLVGVGAYVAAIPFASALASLWAVPGLRRWLGCRDATIRWATAAAVAVVALLVVGLVAVLGVPVGAAAWLAGALAVGAVVRTVTRHGIDWTNPGTAATPNGYLIPVGVILQVVHGPELLVIGILIIGSGLALAAVAPIALGFAAYGVAR